MEIKIRKIGSRNGGHAKIIELTVSDGNVSITQDVTDLDYKVDKDFILTLQGIAYELEEQNDLVAMEEPIAMKAGDERVLVNGRTIPVDYRIITEENYQKLRKAFD